MAFRYDCSQKGELYKFSVKEAKIEDAGEYTLQIGDRPCKANIVVEMCKFLPIFLLKLSLNYLEYMNVLKRYIYLSI